MCRHLAYLGPPLDLASMLLDAPHSLQRQGYAPADMRGGGSVNADGFGVGWYEPGRAEPSRYRRAVPIWTDVPLAELAGRVRTTAALAAVRSASPDTPVVQTACAPFRADRWLFSHNGMVRGWPDSLTGAAAGLPVRDLVTLDAPVDSALLWALVADRLRRGQDPPDALCEVVAETAAAAPGSRLNLLLTNGDAVLATAVRHALSVRRADGAVLVASEPIDERPGWQPVPENHLLVATPSAVELRPIPIPTAPAEEP